MKQNITFFVCLLYTVLLCAQSVFQQGGKNLPKREEGSPLSGLVITFESSRKDIQDEEMSKKIRTSGEQFEDRSWTNIR